MDVIFGAFVLLAIAGFGWYLLVNHNKPRPKLEWFPDEQYNKVLFGEREKPAGKITEATEESRELTDGTVLTRRHIRQWH
jgi:hypothetical protein